MKGSVEILDNHIQQMLTFDLPCFEAAANYFKQIIKNKQFKKFIQSQSDKLIQTYSNVLSTVFGEEGINFDIPVDSYQLIFEPLQKFCKYKGFLEGIDPDTLDIFVDTLLVKLVFSNEIKKSLEESDEEGKETKIKLVEYIVRSFNSLMLKVIAYSNTNDLFRSLFFIIINSAKAIRVNSMNKSIHDLAFKCLMRVIKNLKKNIKKVDPSRIFNLVYNYIQQYDYSQDTSNNIKAIEILLKRVIVYNNIDYILKCYKEIFEEKKFPFIWDIITNVLNSKKTNQRRQTGDLEQ